LRAMAAADNLESRGFLSSVAPALEDQAHDRAIDPQKRRRIGLGRRIS
jgi:hypothetical protein